MMQSINMNIMLSYNFISIITGETKESTECLLYPASEWAQFELMVEELVNMPHAAIFGFMHWVCILFVFSLQSCQCLAVFGENHTVCSIPLVKSSCCHCRIFSILSCQCILCMLLSCSYLNSEDLRLLYFRNRNQLTNPLSRMPKSE